MDKIFQAKQIMTHSGDYHADEVFALSILAYAYSLQGISMPEIVRTRDKDMLNKAVKSKDVTVIDVGRINNSDMLNFDHHQKSFADKWESGIPLSSAGMIFKYLRDRDLLGMSEDGMEIFRKGFVEKVDAMDNGIARFDYFSFIYAFKNPDLTVDQDIAFMQAFDMVSSLVPHLIQRSEDDVVVLDSCRNVYEKARVIDVDGQKVKIVVSHDGDMSSQFMMSELYDDVDFYAMMKPNDQIGVKTAREAGNNPYANMHPVPKSMIDAYESGDDLAELFDFMGRAEFIHKGGFYSVLEGDYKVAVEFIKEVIRRNRKEKK